MKKGILFLLLAASFSAQSQTLKELLYSGKLKNDSNTVVRKTDDLKSKIDTSQKKTIEPGQRKIAAAPADSTGKTTDLQADLVDAEVVIKDSANNTGVIINVPPKTSNKIWKEYTDSLTNSLKTEVLSSKKIKKETYYLTVEYDIETTGKVSITNIIASPENAFLQAQLKVRMEDSPPQLSPVPRKVKKKYNFTITKD